MINFRMRKLLARIALPILSIWLCILPSRSYAFVPASVGLYGVSTAAESAAAVAAAGGVGGSAGAAAFVAAGAFAFGASMLAVGATMGYLIVDNLTGDLVRIPLTASNPVPEPVPVTIPPVSASTVYSYSPSFPELFPYVDSYALAVQDYATWKNNADADCNLTIVSSDANNQTIVTSQYAKVGRSCGSTWSNQTQNLPVSSQNVAAHCEVNYTLTNGSCVPNYPRATPDHSKDYLRTGTTLQPVTVDADNAGSVLTQTSSGSYVLAGLELSGKPTRIEITPLVSGGSIVSYSTQTTSGMFTTVEKLDATIAPDGKVVSVSGTQAQGNIALDTSTAVTGSSVTTGAAVSPSQPITVSFPSDYAKTGEAATAADGIKTKLDTLHNDLSSTSNVADPTEPISGDMPGWGSTFSGLLGWNLPAHGSSCPTPSLDLAFMGLGSHSMTMHCTLINNHFDALNTAMMVVWTVLALFVVLRA